MKNELQQLALDETQEHYEFNGNPSKGWIDI